MASIATGLAPNRWRMRLTSERKGCSVYPYMAVTFVWTLAEVATRTLSVALFATGKLHGGADCIGAAETLSLY